MFRNRKMSVIVVIMCFSLSTILLSFGIASIVLTNNNPNVCCGVRPLSLVCAASGTPFFNTTSGNCTAPIVPFNPIISLPNWLFLTGIFYTSIAGALVIMTIISMITDSVVYIAIVFIPGGLLISVWTIVGAIVWLKYGMDCAIIFPPFWDLTTAITMIMIPTIIAYIALLFPAIGSL